MVASSGMVSVWLIGIVVRSMATIFYAPVSANKKKPLTHPARSDGPASQIPKGQHQLILRRWHSRSNETDWPPCRDRVRALLAVREGR